MYNRTLAARLRRRGALALPVAIAALGFAGSAGAATQPTVVYTPTTGPQLESDVAAADLQPAGTLSIIELGPYLYSIPNPSGTAAMTLNGNIEITGAPKFQYTGLNQEANVNGGSISTPSDMFVVAAGANVLFKAFDLQSGGAYNTNYSAIHVQAGGTAEIDNMAVDGSVGPALYVNSGGTARISNSLMGDGVNAGPAIISSSATNPIVLVNDTVTGNSAGALAGPGFVAVNTLIAMNGGASCTTALLAGSTNNITDAGASVCGSSVSTSTDAALNLAGTGADGGPTVSNQVLAPSSAIGAGLAADCATVDQRFFTRSSGTCDVGSYQTTGDSNTPGGPKQTAGPTCPATGTVNYSSNPATDTVSPFDSGVGLGPDAIQFVANPAPAGTGESGSTGFPTPTVTTPTNNGTVAYPAIGTTWFADTNGNQTLVALDDVTSTSPLAVTASKPVGDVTAGDTKWSFDATNWLGITSYCH